MATDAGNQGVQFMHRVFIFVICTSKTKANTELNIPDFLRPNVLDEPHIHFLINFFSSFTALGAQYLKPMPWSLLCRFRVYLVNDLTHGKPIPLFLTLGRNLEPQVLRSGNKGKPSFYFLFISSGSFSFFFLFFFSFSLIFLSPFFFLL